jgi:GT2 family glycosyltransferase
VYLARSLGVEVVELDLARPFTAARARNAGFHQLLQNNAELTFVQFIDGDCELRESWLQAALRHLSEHSQVAVACGRRRERFPDATAYNRLCDLEWDTPVGETQACGGDFLVRADAFRQVDGFQEDLIAGEEPDLCFRLRKREWKIARLDEEMTLHDAAMTRIGQWWQRSKRSGYADMEASQRRGRYEPQLRRRVWSNLLWSLPPAWPLWPVLWARVYRRRGALYASHIVAGKLAHTAGILAYWSRRLYRRKPKLIEYK